MEDLTEVNGRRHTAHGYLVAVAGEGESLLRVVDVAVDAAVRVVSPMAGPVSEGGMEMGS